MAGWCGPFRNRCRCPRPTGSSARRRPRPAEDRDLSRLAAGGGVERPAPAEEARLVTRPMKERGRLTWNRAGDCSRREFYDHASARPLLVPCLQIDNLKSQAPTCPMGKAVSPRGDMPKNRVRCFSPKDAACPLSIPSFRDDFEPTGAALWKRSIVRPPSLCWSFVPLPQLYRRMPNLKISICRANRSARRHKISSSGAISPLRVTDLTK